MSTGIQRFEFEGQEVRVTVEGEAVWFCAADVCARLEHSNTTAALAGLDDDEKGLRLVETPGGKQQMQHVTEAGLYRLLMRSDMPKAKPFQRWVTHDVLPAIRRTGSFSAPTTREQRIALALVECQDVMAEQARALTEAKPKVEFFDRFTGSGGHLGLMECAKALHLPERKWCAWAISSGYLFRNGDGVLLPYAKYGPQGSGLFEVRTWTVNEIVRVQSFVTPKGYQHFAANRPELDTRRRHLPPAQHNIQPFGGQP